MAIDSGWSGLSIDADRRALGHLAQRRGRRVLPLGQAVDAVVEQHDFDVDIAADGVHQVVAADRQAVAVAGDDPHRSVGPADFQARWPRPAPGRESSGCRRCSCSTETGWSSRCRRRTPSSPAARRASAAPFSSGPGSNSRRSRGTSGRPGRWRNPGQSSTGNGEFSGSHKVRHFVGTSISQSLAMANLTDSLGRLRQQFDSIFRRRFRATVNGLPCTLFSPMASTRNLPRINSRNWPRFNSGISTFS